jgi:O-antigen/teichoic acid export membrane protein
VLPGESAIFRSSSLIFAATAADGLFGAGYWLLVSRSMPVDAAGQSAAVLALMAGVSGLAAAGAGLALIEWLPPLRDRAEWWSVLASTTGAGLAATGLVAAGAVVLLPAQSTAFALLHEPGPLLVFLAGSLAWTAGGLVDHVCVAQAAAGTMVLRNLLFSATKLAALGLVVAGGLSGPFWVVATWTGAMVVVTAVVGGWRLPRLAPATAAGSTAVSAGATATEAAARAVDRSAVRVGELLRSYAGHHVAALSGVAVSSGIPLLVAASVVPGQNAFFRIAWSVEALITLALSAIGLALFAGGRRWPATLRNDLRRAAVMAVLVVTVCVLAYPVAAGPVLEAFGHAYLAGARPLVGLLVAATVPQAVIYLTVAVLRARARIREVAVLSAATSAVALAATAVLVPRCGIVAVGWALLGSRSAAVAAIALRLLTGWRRGHTPWPAGEVR